jgi:hypothetical protein
MMTIDWMMELENSRTSGLWFEINGVGAGELLDFILAKDAEIKRLRRDVEEANARAYVMAKEVALWQSRAALKGDE